MSKPAVQKYYARLIYKGIYTIDQVPEKDKGKVKEYLNDIINNCFNNFLIFSVEHI